MTGKEFIKRAKRHARKTGKTFRFDPRHGKGSHGMLYVGDRRTTVKQGDGGRHFSEHAATARYREGGILMQYAYPCILTSEGDGFSVSFPDIPEALTCGIDRRDALTQAIDALLCKFGDRFKICPQRCGLHAVGVCRNLLMRV